MGIFVTTSFYSHLCLANSTYLVAEAFIEVKVQLGLHIVNASPRPHLQTAQDVDSDTKTGQNDCMHEGGARHRETMC